MQKHLSSYGRMNLGVFAFFDTGALEYISYFNTLASGLLS
jgi:hypothetical protein